MTKTANDLLFGYVESRYGQLHYAECGAGDVVLMLHQTPRSWTEFRLVLPLVGARFRAVAMDTLGFGASAKPDEPHSVERWADAAEDLVDSLGAERFHLVGHHTGAVIAVELAVRHPERVASLLLSSAPYIDEARRTGSHRHPPIDLVEPAPDGTHLAELWNRRRGFYRPGEEDSLRCYVIDALTVRDRAEEGHEALSRYPMEDRLPLVTSRTLAICGGDDVYALPSLPRIAAALGCETRVVKGAHVPLPEQRHEEFSALVLEWAGTVQGAPSANS